MIPPPQLDRTHVCWKNRSLVYFGGCDYFRLASHPRVLRALQRGLSRYGLNVSASRLTTGNHILYELLESELAEFFGVSSAVLAPTGYLSNLIAAQALAEDFTHAFIDAKAHRSLWDAARFLNCTVVPFQHGDAHDLARRLRDTRPSRTILLTDGTFPHSGALAPIDAYVRALPRNATLLVDDAHGAGVHGQRGQGALERASRSRRRIIQTITLSKAFGAYGGAILGPSDFKKRVLTRSGIYAGSTPIPLPLAAAARESLNLLSTNASFRSRLFKNAARFKNLLRQAGLDLPDHPSPIFALAPKSRSGAVALQRELLAAGLHPTFIRYSSGPSQGFFRFAISSEHTRDQLEKLAGVLGKQRGKLVAL